MKWPKIDKNWSLRKLNWLYKLMAKQESNRIKKDLSEKESKSFGKSNVKIKKYLTT